MKKAFLFLTVLAIMTLTAGCAVSGGGVPAFQSVDLQNNLGREDIARYEAEAGKAAQPNNMAFIEKTNWWLPSLVAFWNKGSVQVMAGPKGERQYMVSKTLGLGPLAVLYVSREDAVYGSDGSLNSIMASRSVLWGHLAMFHNMRWKLSEGAWHEHNSSHLIHHAINITDSQCGSNVSLFSAPNPIGWGD